MKLKIITLTIFMFINFPSILDAEVIAESGLAFYEGGITLYKVPTQNIDLAPEANARVRVFNLEFPIFRSPENESEFFALISPPLGVATGRFDTQIVNVQKQKQKGEQFLVQTRGNVHTDEVLSAPELNVLPTDPEIVKRVVSEDNEEKQLLKKITPTKFWQGQFIQPVQNKISSHFGLYRIYSKHIRRRTHWGVDFETPLGTPVKASASGVVVLAKEFYFPGKTIIIDHGLGLYTGYSHLDSMNVNIGDKIEVGQVIGKSGRSGKVTGLLLHWFAVNSRVKMDPLSLLSIKEGAKP